MNAICVLRNDKESFGKIKFSQEKDGAPTTLTVSNAKVFWGLLQNCNT